MNKLIILLFLSPFLFQCTTSEKNFDIVTEDSKSIYICQEKDFNVLDITKNFDVSAKEVYKHFLKNCAELALEKGFESFKVQSPKKQNKTALYGQFHEELKKDVLNPLKTSSQPETIYKASDMHDNVEDFNFD